MPSKDALSSMLSGNAGAIKRGRGVVLSTEATAGAASPSDTTTMPEPVPAPAPAQLAAAPTVPETTAPGAVPPPEAATSLEPSASPAPAQPAAAPIVPEAASVYLSAPAPPPVPSIPLPDNTLPSLASAAPLKRIPRGSAAQGLKNRGYAIRPELAKALKLYAVQQDRTLYDVMDQALTEFAARHGLPIQN
jgi:hypothetical protein